MSMNIDLNNPEVRADIFSVVDQHLAYLYVNPSSFCNVVKEERRGSVASKFRVKVESLSESLTSFPMKEVTQYLVTYHSSGDAYYSDINRCIITKEEVEEILLDMQASSDFKNKEAEIMLVNWYKDVDFSSYYSDIIEDFLLTKRAQHLQTNKYTDDEVRYSYALLTPNTDVELSECTFFLDYESSPNNLPTGKLRAFDPDTFIATQHIRKDAFKPIPYIKFNRFNTECLETEYDFHFKSSNSNDIYGESIFSLAEPMGELEEVVNGVRSILLAIGGKSHTECQAPYSSNFETQAEINRDADVGLYDVTIEGTGDRYSKKLGKEYYEFKNMITQALADNDWVKQPYKPVSIRFILDKENRLDINEVTKDAINAAVQYIDTIRNLKSINNYDGYDDYADTWEDGTPIDYSKVEDEAFKHTINSFPH